MTFPLSIEPFTAFAQDAQEAIDGALRRFSTFDSGCPAALQEAIHYSLLAPGKRLRPLLVLMAAEACGSRFQAALPAACAVEMIHAYSLVHDDLPAMDDDDLRRGRPSCHARFGEATAILVGDALQARAFEVMASLEPAEIAARCCRELAGAAGGGALVGGQFDDLAAESEAGSATVAEDAVDAAELAERLVWIHQRKTGALIRVSLRLGAIVSGADAARLEQLDRYGANLGTAFQIVDDLLDDEGDEATMGKRAHQDAARGKLTYPKLYGREESRRRAGELVERAAAEVAPWGAAADRLQALARFVLGRKN